MRRILEVWWQLCFHAILKLVSVTTDKLYIQVLNKSPFERPLDKFIDIQLCCLLSPMLRSGAKGSYGAVQKEAMVFNGFLESECHIGVQFLSWAFRYKARQIKWLYVVYIYDDVWAKDQTALKCSPKVLPLWPMQPVTTEDLNSTRQGMSKILISATSPVIHLTLGIIFNEQL